MHIPPAPEELTPGYVFANRSLGTAWGVLRDGEKITWKCSSLPGHRPHPFATPARQCAGAERERRIQGGRQVFELYRCTACGVFWDVIPSGGPLRDILAGRCPLCAGPVAWCKVVIIEQGKAGAR